MRATIVLLAAAMAAASASAQVRLDAWATADNLFTAYISTDDGQAGVEFLRGDNWQATYSGSYVLPGPGTYFLHVAATDLGGPRMFIGRFELGSARGRFVNGTRSLLTDPGNWLVSSTGFGVDYVTPQDRGVNGRSPWGFIPQVGSNARFIWHPGSPPTAYFSTRIVVVPAPAGGGVLVVGAVAAGGRRRRPPVHRPRRGP